MIIGYVDLKERGTATAQMSVYLYGVVRRNPGGRCEVLVIPDNLYFIRGYYGTQYARRRISLTD